MSEAQLINTMLYRKLESGSQYSGLIPNYKHVKHSFELPQEFSDTYDTLEYMAYWTNKYANQFQKVANVLKGKNVLETVKNNYTFLYKHFQYKIDESLQQIYAPSAAWHFRKVGFDCKTFSSLASALLLCQDIDHSFVKVKLQGSNDWGHVYVQIPYQGSYLIIDATTHDNKEVNFHEKHEFNMKNLKHIGLASPYLNTPYLNLDSAALSCPGQACDCSSGLSNPYTYPFLTAQPTTPFAVGLNGIDAGSISSIVNQLDFNSIMSLFSGIDCIGGSAYDKDYLRNNTKLMTKTFADYALQINNAALNDIGLLGFHTASFKGFAKMLDAAYKKGKQAQGWNSCSKDNFDATIRVTEFFSITAIQALDAWLNKFFTKGSVLSTLTFKNYKSLTTGYSSGTGYWGTSAGGAETVTINEPEYKYTIKADVSTIPVFELTNYTIQADKANTFDSSTYLQSLNNVLEYFDTPLDTFPGESSTGNNNTNPGSGSAVVKKTTESGGGVIIIGGLVIGALAWGFSKMKDNGPGSKQVKK
ncbi:transglutaminase-like domain-containing protein [Flavobacterium sp. N2820]|uniref:transglutaminase-like domain-containing protein n=1 Tax=Flavobacterium sp. N2820 TaxID=2986834 RepID=UPI0022259B5F|nr:transglutaminase-like domain-containing protein [Flavobacterium sp. N2820]